MKRASFINKLVNHQAPIERDPEFRRFWREQVIFPGGLLRAKHLLYVDETNKRNGDCATTRAFLCQRTKCAGANLGNQSRSFREYHGEYFYWRHPKLCRHWYCTWWWCQRRNVPGDIRAQYCTSLPTMAWQEICCCSRQCRCALKVYDWCRTECSTKGVIALYLPPRSFDYNSMELVFHIAKMKLQRDHGHGIMPINIKMHDKTV